MKTFANGVAVKPTYDGDGAEDRQTLDLLVQEQCQSQRDDDAHRQADNGDVGGVQQGFPDHLIRENVQIVFYADPFRGGKNAVIGKAVIDGGADWIYAKGQKADQPRRQKEKPDPKKSSFPFAHSGFFAVFCLAACFQ